MAIIKLLRVIDSEGFGMYRNYQSKISLANYVFGTSELVDFDQHPLPTDDYPIFEVLGYCWSETTYKDWKFAFLNRSQFFKWVYDPQWRRYMDDLDAKLLVITINSDNCLIGRYQVMYNPEKIIETKEFRVTDFDSCDNFRDIETYLK